MYFDFYFPFDIEFGSFQRQTEFQFFRRLKDFRNQTILFFHVELKRNICLYLIKSNLNACILCINKYKYSLQFDGAFGREKKTA